MKTGGQYAKYRTPDTTTLERLMQRGGLGKCMVTGTSTVGNRFFVWARRNIEGLAVI